MAKQWGFGVLTHQENNFELLDAKEVRQILKCSLPCVYKMADREQLPCVRVPCPGEGQEKPRTMVRFKRADILDFIERHYATT
jgi:predicted DNA-binding transcriptional regulator AlpA